MYFEFFFFTQEDELEELPKFNKSEINPKPSKKSKGILFSFLYFQFYVISSFPHTFRTAENGSPVFR